MNRLHFSWDLAKAISNLRKHRVSFEEAQTVFYDEEADLINDPDHSMDEARFVMLGLSCKARLLIVCHCYRKDSSVIRIISARRANAHEAQFYRGIT
jgi:uncharacterized DUF497 family protein